MKYLTGGDGVFDWRDAGSLLVSIFLLSLIVCHVSYVWGLVGDAGRMDYGILSICLAFLGANGYFKVEQTNKTNNNHEQERTDIK